MSIWFSRLSTSVVLVAGCLIGPSELTAFQADPQPVTNSEAADLKAIDDLSKRAIAATTSDDVDAQVALWTDDGVYIAPGAPPTVGNAAIRKLLAQQKAQANGATTIAFSEHWEEVRVLGDYAYQWGSVSATVRTAEGKETGQTAQGMRILKRDGSSWKIARAVVTP